MVSLSPFVDKLQMAFHASDCLRNRHQLAVQILNFAMQKNPVLLAIIDLFGDPGPELRKAPDNTAPAVVISEIAATMNSVDDILYPFQVACLSLMS